MHESLRYVLEKVLSHYSAGEFYNTLLLAKDDYFSRTGKAFEEDEDYESRMASFNDWYCLQYQSDETGKTFFQKYVLENSVLPEIQEAINGVNHSLFEYLGTNFRGHHVLKDFLHDKKVVLAKEHSAPSMVKGDLFIGRSAFYKEENFLFNGLRMMPKDAKKPMVREAKRVRKLEGDHHKLDFLLFTESLKTKWQRYGHIDVEKIFFFPEGRTS